jgi:hypothetical protein
VDEVIKVWAHGNLLQANPDATYPAADGIQVTMDDHLEVLSGGVVVAIWLKGTVGRAESGDAQGGSGA